MKKKKGILDKLYLYDKDNNSYNIDIALDKYDDIYNEWDPTPFRKRDIEEEFVNYVIDSSNDIPMKYGINLNLYLPKDKEDLGKEKNAKIAIKSYFSYLLDRNKRSVEESLIRCLRSLVIGAVLLIFFYLSASKNNDKYFGKVVVEGICILGWVALWDVGEEFLFNLVNKFKKRRNLKRISRAKVEFIYK